MHHYKGRTKTVCYQGVNNCLSKYRRIRGFTQRDVAKILGFRSASIISRWEHGVCMPDLLNVFKLTVLYRTLTDCLFVDLIRLLRAEILEREKQVLKQDDD